MTTDPIETACVAACSPCSLSAPPAAPRVAALMAQPCSVSNRRTGSVRGQRGRQDRRLGGDVDGQLPGLASARPTRR